MELSIIERLIPKIKIDSSGCWLFIGSRDELGYGRFRDPKSKSYLMSAHRSSYLLFRGKIPDGMIVCHSCDNPSCVNPSHLFIGSHKDNSLDMMKKGRDRIVGIKNGRAKLTEENILNIRFLYDQGELSDREIGKLYGVVETTIANIGKRNSWKHV